MALVSHVVVLLAHVSLAAVVVVVVHDSTAGNIPTPSWLHLDCDPGEWACS